MPLTIWSKIGGLGSLVPAGCDIKPTDAIAIAGGR